MAESFEAQVARAVAKADRRAIATFRQSAQEVVNIMQKPVAKGGRMRVKTGFLRNSGTAAINDAPSGPDINPGSRSFDWDENAVILKIVSVRMGDSFMFGWSANYARAREYKDGFMRGAVGRWQKIVEKNARRAAKEIF